MASRPNPFASIVLVALVALAGCQKPPAAVDPVTPDASVRAAVAGLKTADLKSLVQTQLPPAELQKMREEWKQERQAKPVTDEDRKKFAEMMAELTAPGAEAQLYKKVDPQLAKFEAEIGANLPAWIDLGRGLVEGGIKSSKEMSEAQKAEAIKSLDSIAKWAKTIKFTDREQAKKTIAIACRVARDVKLKTLDEARALEFDQALEKFSIAFAGLKEILANYGLSLDKVLDTVKAETLAQNGDTAKVAVSYTLLDAQIRYEAEMTRIDGRWYGKDALERLHRKQLETDESGNEAHEPAPAPPAAPGDKG